MISKTIGFRGTVVAGHIPSVDGACHVRCRRGGLRRVSGKNNGGCDTKKGLAFGGSRGCGMSHVSDSSRHFMVFCVLVFALQ